MCTRARVVLGLASLLPRRRECDQWSDLVERGVYWSYECLVARSSRSCEASCMVSSAGCCVAMFRCYPGNWSFLRISERNWRSRRRQDASNWDGKESLMRHSAQWRRWKEMWSQTHLSNTSSNSWLNSLRNDLKKLGLRYYASSRGLQAEALLH
jgi:hypothetical protein